MRGSRNGLDIASEAPLPATNRETNSRMELVGDRPREIMSGRGHSLFQDVFFLCNVKGIGDLPGAGCIYVEVVADRDSGAAFAKLYLTPNASNAVDLLASRVLPFFKRQGIAVREIFTPRKRQYCGVIAAHPYETFLAVSHIEHPGFDQQHPHNYLCEEFYRFLRKEFLEPALRKTFQLSLDRLQKDLDEFVSVFNTARWSGASKVHRDTPQAAKFPVDL